MRVCLEEAVELIGACSIPISELGIPTVERGFERVPMLAPFGRHAVETELAFVSEF